ncbi:hypothetical protein R1sor_027267 [Riccia sorocarpa]|uniref:Uncharacterized protein n=1 Tax=Riccia sorocarpa TaxID=122646 RepID=A0ABD3GHY8_9MARC
MSGSKRNSPEGEIARDKIGERIIHLELENRFLEERLKVVEEEARAGRLRIDELRCEIRECSEERDADRKRVAQQSADLHEMFRLYEHVAKKWRSLLDEKKAARAEGTPWKSSESASDYSAKHYNGISGLGQGNRQSSGGVRQIKLEYLKLLK